MKIHTSIVLALVICLVTSSWVQNQSVDQLAENVRNSKNIWLAYHGKSSDVIQTLDQISQVFRGIFNIATVQPSSENGQLTLIGDDQQNPIVYSGDFSIDSIVKFVLQNTDQIIQSRSKVAKQLKANQQFQQKQAERAKKQWEEQQKLRQKSDTIVLDAKNWNSFLTSRDAYVINFYESNCSACIELNRQWEQVSIQLKGKVKIAKVNITQQGNHILEEQIKLENYPSIRFYSNGPKKVSQFSQFNGINKRFSLLEWINSKLNEKTESAQIPALTKQNYQNLCKSTKNTCIIVFTSEQNSQVSQKVEELTLKHLKKPITFLISKKGEQTKFAEQLGVETYPNSVLIYCKQKKLWKTDEFNPSVIDEAISQISMGNRNNFQRYAFTQDIV